ncbi:hypothetical protein FRB95_011248 [Tulasnella sp. JGI-2019a]|nr:hypothetical protein FRB95_011248 [Tulasnella sp. JGI-2019a]
MEDTLAHGHDLQSSNIFASFDPSLITIPEPNRPAGGGGYSDLFRGRYGVEQSKVALKRIRCSTTEVKQTGRRLKREGMIRSRLKHANVLPFYATLEMSSEVYLEPSISPELRSTYLAFDEAETIHGIASGLAYLHEAHVIHGDLKASNVLLDDSVTPMICDFGLTKNDQFHTTSDTMKGAGTVRWMCPSLMDGAPRSKKTDIYAFGMTIVEILTGKVPFPDLQSLSGVLFAVSEGRRPPFEPSARNDRDFKPLWDLAASCWQTQPAVRPGSYEILGRLADLALNTVGR